MSKYEKAEANIQDSQNALTLGEFLANIRKITRQSLRAVEEATGKKVSNAYLSQLEKGHIKKPSPNILHSLAGAYSVPYEVLMEKAGYISEVNDQLASESNRNIIFADKNLTPEEEEELLTYLSFIRSKKQKVKAIE